MPRPLLSDGRGLRRAATGLWLGLIALCLAAPIAFCWAQPVDQVLFRNYLASSAHHDLVEAALNGLPPEVFTRCPAFRPNEPDVTVKKPVAFAQDGSPNAGAWMESFPVRGCGNDTILHLNFVAGEGGKLNAFMSLPGTTRADLILQHDALSYAFLGPRLRVKDCERMFVTNTRFETLDSIPVPDASAKTKPLPKVSARAWREVWSVSGCGHRFDVPMRFIPDETGTQIVQKTDEMTER
jgi:hypothetical protein